MRMQVSEHGDEVLIELFGVAGRHQQILQALTEGPLPVGRGIGLGDAPRETADIHVRAGTDEMRIRIKARAGNMLEALAIYRYLRHELVELHGAGCKEADAVIRAVRGVATA